MKNFLLVLMFVSLSAFADRDDECRGDPHHCHDDDGGGVPIEVEAEADADASAEANSESGAEANASGGNVSITNKRPGTSFIGGGDSTASDQKVFAIGGGWLSGNASFRFDLTDKDARVLRIAREWNAEGNHHAADKLQCSVKVVWQPFGSPEECYDALNQPEPEPVGRYLSHGEYHELTMAQVQQEEFDEAVEQAEFRYVQQQSLIEELEKEHEEDDAEIELLKRDAAIVKAQQDKEAAVRSTKQMQLGSILQRLEAADREPDDDGPI